MCHHCTNLSLCQQFLVFLQLRVFLTTLLVSLLFSRVINSLLYLAGLIFSYFLTRWPAGVNSINLIL